MQVTTVKRDEEPKQIRSQTTTENLLSKIIQSEDKLFFIANHNHYDNRKEWRLVQVDLHNTMKERPNSINDNLFKVNYYIVHPKDTQYHPVNQRLWKQYVQREGKYVRHDKTHLVRPTSNHENYCRQKNIVALSQWVQLDDESTFIHGPFEFATIQGRKTTDRISPGDWQILCDNKSKYSNEPPNISTRSHYAYYVNSQFHEVHYDTKLSNEVHALLGRNYYHDEILF